MASAQPALSRWLFKACRRANSWHCSKSRRRTSFKYVLAFASLGAVTELNVCSQQGNFCITVWSVIVAVVQFDCPGCFAFLAGIFDYIARYFYKALPGSNTERRG